MAKSEDRFKQEITITTDAGGNADETSEFTLSGILNSVFLANADFDPLWNVDITLVDNFGEPVWSESALADAADRRKYVSPQLNDPSGAVIDNVARGVIAPAKSRVRIVISGGGNAKSGTFRFITR